MKKDTNRTNHAANVVCFLFFFSAFMFITSNINAQSAKWVAPKETDDLKNPLAGNNTSLKEGKTLYMSYCTPCHGDKGRGDGVAAASLSVKPADHSSDNVQKETDGALYWMITQGRNPMPTYQQTLSDNQRWELVAYIRTLGRTIAKNSK